jgi:hypothetical protein
MAFENSSATDPKDLLQKLNTFLAANGWTTDSSAADGAGWRVHLHNSAGQYAHLRAQLGEHSPFVDNHGVNGYSIALYLGSGFTSGNAWNQQNTGSPQESGSTVKPVGVGMALQNAAIPNYYFFTDAGNANVVVVVENLSGIYSHMGWGMMTSVGTITGGDYFFGSRGGYYLHDTTNPGAGDAVLHSANCPGIWIDIYGLPAFYVRCDVDSFTSKWLSSGTLVTAFLGYTGKLALSPIGGGNNPEILTPNTEFPSYFSTYGGVGDFQSNQTSLIDGRANLLPVLIYALRDGSGTGYSPIGFFPTVWASDGVGSGFGPAEDYLIGADTYTMFPEFAVLKVV